MKCHLGFEEDTQDKAIIDHYQSESRPSRNHNPNAREHPHPKKRKPTRRQLTIENLVFAKGDHFGCKASGKSVKPGRGTVAPKATPPMQTSSVSQSSLLHFRVKKVVPLGFCSVTTTGTPKIPAALTYSHSMAKG